MTTGREMRVSDRERQAAADRLNDALAEGRLDFAEYDHRLGQAYGAVTYADLDRLFGDLPAAAPAPVAVRPAPRPAAPVRQPDALATGFARLPLALKILWTLWSVAMAVNLTVWVLVGVMGDGGITYFWPAWLLVPGAALTGATFAVAAVRDARRGSGGR